MPTTDNHSQSEPDPREEYFESTPTDVELEDQDPSQPEDPEPWDPEKIRRPHEALFATSSRGHDH